jgi:large subunit ribosomal protein L9
MKIILKQDIKGIGKKYEVKNVADGYANNFLIPKKLAEYASPESIKKAQVIKAQEEAEREIKEKLTAEQIEMLKSIKIFLQKKANEKGHLFEQIHPAEIVTVLKEQAKVEINPEFLTIEKPIKEIGEHRILAQAGKTEATFLVIVEPSK